MDVKRRYLILAVLLMAMSCELSDQRDNVSSDLINNTNSAYEDVDQDKLPVFEFDTRTFDFGIISQGEKVLHKYKFENIGETPLVIASVEGSCGCTVSKNWPKTPVRPGDSGEIEVEFNSENRSGTVAKHVTILANTSPATTVLELTGKIAVPEPIK